MDYLILYSNHSEACATLFDMFTNLQDLKGVCVDDPAIRSGVMRSLHVTVVPTLLLISRRQVLQRIIGLEHIRNWLMIEHGLVAGRSPSPPSPPPSPANVSDLPDIQRPPIKQNARSLAEEMQKEREEILKSSSQGKQTR